jgi:hypothetical protein
VQPVSATWANTVTGSHVINTLVEAWYNGARIRSLAVVDGTVTVDASASQRRTYSATLAEQGSFPSVLDVTGVLAPYGTIHKVWRGLWYPTGTTEWVQLGTFRVDTIATGLEAGTVRVTGSDLSRVVADSRFLQPTTSVTTNSIRQEIARLIRTSGLGASYPVIDTTGDASLTPALTWDRDRWQAIQDLATSVGGEVIFGPDGTAIVQPAPAITDPIDWRVVSTQIVVTGERALDRAQTYNMIVATGERTDNVAPARGVAQDLNRDSPTYVGGPFGVVPAFYSSPVLTTNAAALKAAGKILARTRGMARRLTFQCVPNPAVDVGDVLTFLMPDGTTSERHIVDTLQIPLAPSGPMTVTTRTSVEEGLS